MAKVSAASTGVGRFVGVVVLALVLLDLVRQFHDRRPELEALLAPNFGPASVGMVVLGVVSVLAVLLVLVSLGAVVGSRLTRWKASVGLMGAYVVLAATWLGWAWVSKGQESLWEFAPSYIAVGYVLAVLKAAPESIKVTWMVDDLLREQARVVEDLGEDFPWVVAHLDPGRVETWDELRKPPVVRPPDFEVFGKAGISLLAGVGKGLNRGSVWKGIKGEKLTTEIIRGIAPDYPGLSLIQNSKVPGHENWDVDHALVYGNLVVLIDSKFYRKGTYAWVGNRIEDYDRNGKFSIANNHAMAGALVSEHLPADAEYALLVVIHSSNGGQVETFNAGDSKPLLVSAEDSVAALRSLLDGQNLPAAGATRGVAARRHQHLVRLLAGSQARSEGAGVRTAAREPVGGDIEGEQAPDQDGSA